MKHDRVTGSKRKSVNLSIDAGVIAAAREAGVNLSKVSETAIREAARKAQELRWQHDHRAWIDANNAWVEQNGLPLDKLRLF
ncbi:type II toxin-antitoxin system CcdA family antitoxin [Sphingomonas sp. TZW2008]|uniref:type II toxin-antitoxin system CcdA family antitoxin n=1 Tax=Sphingomonas sp. TZW2008 TaxID=1917973 RepID=UPI000A26DE33|nr:type II toxin-antitoxin system CcdA family antitoxin [Sphingomonas sp. TZW2008]